MSEFEKVDITIIQKPIYIEFECPECEKTIGINNIEWDQVMRVSREIKFRAWDKEKNKMFYSEDWWTGSNGFVSIVEIYKTRQK